MSPVVLQCTADRRLVHARGHRGRVPPLCCGDLYQQFALLFLLASCLTFSPAASIPIPTIASIKAYPASLEDSGGIITAEWHVRFAKPDKYFVGVYLASEDVMSSAPIKGSLDTPQIVAKSNTVTVNPTRPTGGRLALTGKAGEMRVSWISLHGLEGQQVQYGSAPNALNSSVDSEASTTYTRQDLCGGYATTAGYRNPGGFYTAIIPSLKPGIRVFYRYGSDTDGWSPTAAFLAPPPSPSAPPAFAAAGMGGEEMRSRKVAGPPVPPPPPPPPPPAKVRFFAFGDLGTHTPDDTVQHWDAPASSNTTDAMLADADKGEVGFVLHLGGLSYAVGHAAQWDQFHAQVEPLARRTPWMTGIGTYERAWPGSGSARGTDDSGGECGVPYSMRFPMPAPAPPSPYLPPAPPPAAWDTPWYSFDYGAVHVAVLSTEHRIEDQVPWLVTDLAAVNRNATPWVVVAGHRPMYVSSVDADPAVGDQAVAAELRLAIEDVLYAAEVDLVLSSHHRSYQRTCSLYRGQCSPNATYNGPIYAVVGMGGFPSSPNVQRPQPPAFRIVDCAHHGYARITADATNLVFEYVRSDDRLVHDTMALTRVNGSTRPLIRRG